MLYSTIAKLQGKNKWPNAIATVTGNEIISEGGGRSGPPIAKITFGFRDEKNELQSGQLKADSMTSLYNIKTGDTFDIQYNPKNPSKVYTDEADSPYDSLRTVIWASLGLGALIIVILSLFKK